MHNWEHYGRLPAYLLAATLVASCGGGDDGDIIQAGGESGASVLLTAVAGTQLTSKGEISVQVSLTDANNKPLANKEVILTQSSTNISLPVTSLITDSKGIATFKIKGNLVGALTSSNQTGVVQATYIDEKGDKKIASIGYRIVDITQLQSSYKLSACFVLANNPCASTVGLTVSGANSTATAEFTVLDASNKPVVGKRVTFSLLSDLGDGTLLATTDDTDNNGKVSVQVQGGRYTSKNSVIATVKDDNEVSASSLLIFDTIVGNKVSFSAAKSDLTSGGDTVDLEALVLSSAGGTQIDVPVTFSLVNPNEKGVVLSPSVVSSDVNGKAKTKLEIKNIAGYDPSNHIIQVKASIGSGIDSSEEIINFNVVGTTLELTSATTSVKTGATPVITGILKNGKGALIVNQNVKFESVDIIDTVTGAALNKTLTTDSQGKVVLDKIQVATSATTATITALGAGASDSIIFDVSARNFDLKFVKDGKPITEIDIAQGGNVELMLTDDSGVTLPDSIPVTVSTTLGQVVLPVVLTKVDGFPNIRKATVQITSKFPGNATVQAVIDETATQKRISASGTVEFVSKIADKLDVQAINPILLPKGQTNIIAKVLDGKDNPVKGVDVSFTLENPLGGQLDSPIATTDEKGVAQVNFIAGPNVSGTEKIKVIAKVADKFTNSTGERTDSLNLTVGGEAVFITLATGNEILELKEGTQYALPYQVMVTDATGAPIANKEVKLSIWPVNYYKGFYVFNEEKKKWSISYTATCSNEDANQNGQKDVLEDNKQGVVLSPLDYPVSDTTDVEDNGDGLLWPGNPVSLSTSTLKTGSDGVATFSVVYGQSTANWVRVKLTAQAGVSGTESRTNRIFGVPMSAADAASEGSPPGGSVSPYGSSTSCNNPN